ncbi:hypothetical protein B0T22DRAFT_72741 [Podospora appendiculata]|uniref:MARVEL domain-containing protein n=1 Tax=Podospora appendiculata TaxID=314037 RepID=A0AAE0XJC6_9PEZI|nr:hypothetical protein B0T22DRAFT_72741 [Podospora appendiculata]
MNKNNTITSIANMATRPRPRPEKPIISPPGFYGPAIVVTHIAAIVALVAAMGLAAYLASVTSGSQRSLPVILVSILVVTPVAILWTALSWNGYSKKYLPEGTAWALDFIFLVPFASITILLWLPLSTGRCSDIPPTGSFVLIVPPGTSFGVLSFPNMGQAACNKLLALWGLLAAVCVLFVTSALLTSLQQLGNRATGEGRNTKTTHIEADADFFHRQGQIEMGNVTPARAAQSAKSWASRSDTACSHQEPRRLSDPFHAPNHRPPGPASRTGSSGRDLLTERNRTMRKFPGLPTNPRPPPRSGNLGNDSDLEGERSGQHPLRSEGHSSDTRH